MKKIGQFWETHIPKTTKSISFKFGMYSVVMYMEGYKLVIALVFSFDLPTYWDKNYICLQKCLPGKDIILKLFLAILEKGFWMESPNIKPTNSYISESQNLAS